VKKKKRPKREFDQISSLCVAPIEDGNTFLEPKKLKSVSLFDKKRDKEEEEEEEKEKEEKKNIFT
jgi:hypothetical protein